MTLKKTEEFLFILNWVREVIGFFRLISSNRPVAIGRITGSELSGLSNLSEIVSLHIE